MKEKFISNTGYRAVCDKKNKYVNNIHRDIAYQKIYLKDRKHYPLPFSRYDVHHINENKLDNRPANLEILLREKHCEIHGLVKKK
jgi:hypothetical protein